MKLKRNSFFQPDATSTLHWQVGISIQSRTTSTAPLLAPPSRSARTQSAYPRCTAKISTVDPSWLENLRADAASPPFTSQTCTLMKKNYQRGFILKNTVKHELPVPHQAPLQFSHLCRPRPVAAVGPNHRDNFRRQQTAPCNHSV